MKIMGNSNNIEKIAFTVVLFANILLYIGLFYLLVVGTAIWSYAVNRWTVHFPALLFTFIFIALLGNIALQNYNKLIGQFLSLLISLGLGTLWLMYFIFPEKAFCIDFPAYSQFLSLIGLICALMSIVINIFCLMRTIAKKPFRDPNNYPHSYQKRNKIRIIALCTSFFLMVSFGTNWYHPSYEITIPAEFDAPQLNFSFWSFLNISYFSPEQWNQLNHHHAIIIAYEWIYPFTGNISDGIHGSYQNITRNHTIDAVKYLRDNYPEIRIMFPIFGGYLEANDYLIQLNAYLDVIRKENLSNVIGFNYDLERHNDTCWHDAELLNTARLNLQESIRLIREFNPNFRIDNTGGIWMMFDNLPLGGAFELYKQHALMSVSGWDNYAWQLYRGNAVDQSSDPKSSDITERIMSSVAYLGENHTIPLFGMNGVGDYGPNNCTSDTCNFQGIIRDCQIARGLGVHEVQFYTLCTAGIYQNVYYPSMFEAYGSDFLNILNASTNGLNASKMISVPGNQVLKGTVGYWWENMAISLPIYSFIGIMIISILSTFIILRHKRIREYNIIAG